MGREIRRVPPDWEHPRYTAEDAPFSNRIGDYVPLFDRSYETACEEWYAQSDLWRVGKHPSQIRPCASDCKWYHEYDGDPPDKMSYRARAWTPEEATHYQVYETVSEGTPVTPHFATKDELIEYLVANGDFWDQKRVAEGRQPGPLGWARQATEQFVKREWAPSLIGTVSAGHSDFRAPRDGFPRDMQSP